MVKFDEVNHIVTNTSQERIIGDLSHIFEQRNVMQYSFYPSGKPFLKGISTRRQDYVTVQLVAFQVPLNKIRPFFYKIYVDGGLPENKTSVILPPSI